jgi:3'-phosphoadenosine 5'-phosphosulfate sulfotransferase (PAPS reductase)/FAD synthetase
MRTLQDLYQLQSLPLSIKVRMTQDRIKQWVDEYGSDGVYVSFSGGKDSTVLLHIVRDLYPNVKAAFFDTGLEFPEVRQFVKKFDNVDWLKPDQTFKQVVKKYGYPFISKEVSECVSGARKYLKQILETLNKNGGSGGGTLPDNNNLVRMAHEETIIAGHRHIYYYETERILGTCHEGIKHHDKGLYKDIPREELAELLNRRMKNKEGGSNQRLAIMLGMLTDDKDNPVQAYPGKRKSRFSQEKYAFFLDAPFEISNRCCYVMKKAPAHKYHKATGRRPMTAQTASESRLRTQKWIQNGCNGFNLKNPISNPMSFWTEQDVLLYIKIKNLPICSVYGDIVREDGENKQLHLEELENAYRMGLFEPGRPILKTTGYDRTGCVFCGFGAQCEKIGRFERLRETHPELYSYIMKPESEGGLGYKEKIDWINENGNLHIRY